jgi:hypothetical protein
MNIFLEQEQSIHPGKFLATVDKISSSQKGKVHYAFEVVSLEGKTYEPLAYVPPDALKMYENKRKILTEELFKRQEEQRNRDDMLK